MFGTTAPVATDTFAPNVNAYLRKNPDANTYEINLRVNPTVTEDTWLPIDAALHSTLVVENPDDSTPTVGRLIAMVAQSQKMEREWRQTHDLTRKQAFDAIDIIGQRLLQEAENRGWCSEFDEIIDQVNGQLPGHFQLPTRERDYNVCWTETYTITVQRSATVTARNEDQACDLASEMYCGEADEYEMRDAISYGNYEFSDDNSDFEAEEA